MANTLSLLSLPTEVLLNILCSLPDLQAVGCSNLTCRRIHDVCVKHTKAITHAFISSIECSELAIQYYEVRLQLIRCAKDRYVLPPRLLRQHSPIQRAHQILALDQIGHRAQGIYLAKMETPTAIDREFWQSIFYSALILSSTVQRQTLEIEPGDIKVKVFGDLDILTLSQFSDIYVALNHLFYLTFSLRQTEVPGDSGWLVDDGIPFHSWHTSWYAILCIRSYLCEYTWYRHWTCGIGEGNFMTRHKLYGKLVKDLVDEGDRALDIRRDAYSGLFGY